MNNKVINFEGLEFHSFTEQDIDVLTPVMKAAFDEDSRRHTSNPSGGPPGYDNGDFFRKWYLNRESKAYKILSNGRPIGAFNVWINRNGVNFLGNIFIDPDFQDRGTGTVVWRFIEKTYPDTIKWCTETPAFSRRNHNFYINKCGFRVVRIDNPKKESGGFFVLEKTMGK